MNTDEATRVYVLRTGMVTELRELGAIYSDRIADAFVAVPRHLFTPEEPWEKVYAANSAVVISATSTA